MKKICNFIVRHKEIVNLCFPVFIFSYYLLITFPTILANFSYETIFNVSLFSSAYKGLILVFFVFFSLVFYIANSIKFNRKLFLILLFLFFFSCISMLLTLSPVDIKSYVSDSNGLTNDFTIVSVKISLFDNVISLADTFSILFSIYFFVDVFPKILDCKFMKKICSLVFLFSIFLLTYIILFQRSSILSSIKNFPDGDLLSLFSQKNSFSKYMFTPFVCGFYLFYFYKNKLVGFLLIIEMFFILISGCINIDLSIILFIFIFLLIYSFKKNKLVFYSIIGLFGIIFIIITASFFNFTSSIPVFLKIRETVVSFVNDPRIIVWQQAMKSLFHFPFIIFGYGDKNILTFMSSATLMARVNYLNTPIIHNGFLHVMLSGGIFRIAAYIILLASIFVKMFKLSKQGLKNINYYMPLFCAFMFFQLFESSTIGSLTVDSFMISMLLISFINYEHISFNKRSGDLSCLTI